MQWPEPAYTEQSLARVARPTKGGAVRIRIALGTAVAVIAIPAIFFAFFSSSSAASARVTRHEAISQHRTVKINDTLMSYAQRRPQNGGVRQAVAWSTTPTPSRLRQVKTYLTEIAYLQGGCGAEAAAGAAQQHGRRAGSCRSRRGCTVPGRRRAGAGAGAGSGSGTGSCRIGGGSDATSTNTADWACIRQHESGGNYAVGNGGAYQFELGTWHALTGLPSPAQDYPPAVQDAAALKLYSERGWEPWTTRYVCGL